MIDEQIREMNNDYGLDDDESADERDAKIARLTAEVARLKEASEIEIARLTDKIQKLNEELENVTHWHDEDIKIKRGVFDAMQQCAETAERELAALRAAVRWLKTERIFSMGAISAWGLETEKDMPTEHAEALRRATT